jgi:hypothetical protein
MGLRTQWVKACIEQSSTPAEFYSGCRKIHTGLKLEFTSLDDSLRIEDAGFTKMKLTLLRKLYHSDEHAEQVAALWARRVDQGKYGSVGMSTYHHLTKGDPTKKSKRASVMGPCLLGVTATLLEDRSIAIDAFYRTTELFKKFPADLVHIRDTVLPSLGVDSARVRRLRCHFAGVTSHPMYAVTWLALRRDPVADLATIKIADAYFHDWILKWSGRYLCDEFHRGIAKFAQALRVQKDARTRITGDRLRALQKYIRDNHPGYRNDYDEGEDDDA